MGFYKTIVITIFEQWLYHDIFFPCQALIILGSFDKIVPMKKMSFGYCQWELGFWCCQWRLGFLILPVRSGLLILPMKIMFWCCQWKLGFTWCQRELGFDIANEILGFKYCQRELGFDFANENWALMLPMKIGI